MNGISSGSASGESLRLLLASSSQEDRRVVARLARTCGWQVREAWTVEEALAILTTGGFAVVLAEATLMDGSWRNIWEKAAELERPPAFLVGSREAGRALWEDARAAAGARVLVKPFDEAELRDAIGRAHSQWASRLRPQHAHRHRKER